ncbi:MAG TPA: thiamine pyrophosphate-dependent enzyme [Aliidongia sp.]|nr:thiamine pyrophosphate-dependent enzyme [Aliidongia sp.]
MSALERRQVVAELLRDRPADLLVVTGLGSPSYDTMAAGDDDRNFYLWAAMGSAATVGLGLALAQPDRRVLVVTGDGELLMGMGALATIGVKQPRNLTIAVLDNSRYGETGMQESHTAAGVRLEQVAKACGFPHVLRVSEMSGLGTVKAAISARSGPTCAVIEIAAENPPRVLPPRDGVHLKNRFRAALGFPTL